ncbi:hypothetical protein WJX84_004551 [Apatococcus fuscideae]|uniref:ATPase AAA-type core domain-containing protein n=1 Tax=Apatococcus fuscideae TaxID=2026836 RepID=A0AAW1RX99_9CHLO
MHARSTMVQGPGGRDPQAVLRDTERRRKGIQAVHLGEFAAAIEPARGKLLELEGQDMRDAIQEKINKWYLDGRDPETGEYPTFPPAEVGGSKVILKPPAEPVDAPAEAPPPEKPAKEPPKEDAKVGTAFIDTLEDVVRVYVDKWQDRDEVANLAQRHDVELLKDELRPLVFEGVRQQVDDDMRIVLQNLKDMMEAERIARTGKKAKEKKGGKGGGAKKKAGKKEAGGKARKDPTADRSIESLYEQLVVSGIAGPSPARHMADYVGAFAFLGTMLAKAKNARNPSLPQIRQAITEFALLPLGSQYAWDSLAPAVIYIDEVEKVFVMDKKKAKEFGGSEPFNRMKKDLIKEVAALDAADRVIVIGSSSEPQTCVVKDEVVFKSLFNKFFYLPLPDYASRQMIWPALIERHGGSLRHTFGLSTLAHVSDGYSTGAFDQVVKTLLTDERKAALASEPLQVQEVLQGLSKMRPPSQDSIDALDAWCQKLLEPPKPKEEEENAKDKKGKDSKDKKKPTKK